MRLIVDGVGVRRAGRRVLGGLCLKAEAGEIVGVVGPNGAGKSTLLAIIAGALPPGDGEVLIEGISVWGPERERRKARRLLGYVPEAADPPGHLIADEVLALVAAVKGSQPLESAVRTRLGIDPIAAVRIDRMSLGQRRRTCLAAALVGAPGLLVLDEPDNGLDPAGARLLAELIREQASSGVTVILATHDDGLMDAVGARRVPLRPSGVSVSG